MGFTFSHPALILPAKQLPRRYYSFTGLFVGSIVPDFEYFISLHKESVLSHTWYGAIIFDLPLAIILALGYHQLIRDTLIANLPSYFNRRLSRFQGVDWPAYFRKHTGMVCASILAGTFTHFLWDSFTSINGYFVGILPALTVELHIGGITFYVYKLVKHLTSLLGAGFIVWEFNRLRVAKACTKKGQRFFWPLFVLLGTGLLIVLIYVQPPPKTYNHYVKTAITSGLVSLLFTALVFRKRKKPNHERC